MSDIAAWLTAIWDEQEAAAEGNGTIAWLTFREADGSMRYTAVASGEPDDHWVIDGDERTDYASADVVLDWHAVLARIAADRQILLLHGVAWNAEVCTICHHYPDGETPERAAWPCLTVRVLAVPYADRPGYQESWRPARLP